MIKEKTDKQWLNEKTMIVLKRKEMFQLANIVAMVQYQDAGFCKIKDKRIRQMFEKNIKQDHKLWLKIVHTAERYNG